MTDILVSLICVVLVLVVFFYPYHVIAIFDSINDPVLFALDDTNFYRYYQVSEDGKEYELRVLDGHNNDIDPAYYYRKAEVLPESVVAVPCSELDHDKNLLCKQPVVDSYYNRLMSRFKFINTLDSRAAAENMQYSSTLEKRKLAGDPIGDRVLYGANVQLTDLLGRI